MIHNSGKILGSEVFDTTPAGENGQMGIEDKQIEVPGRWSGIETIRESQLFRSLTRRHENPEQ